MGFNTFKKNALSCPYGRENLMKWRVKCITTFCKLVPFLSFFLLFLMPLAPKHPESAIAYVPYPWHYFSSLLLLLSQLVWKVLLCGIRSTNDHLQKSMMLTQIATLWFYVYVLRPFWSWGWRSLHYNTFIWPELLCEKVHSNSTGTRGTCYP